MGKVGEKAYQQNFSEQYLNKLHGGYRVPTT